MKKFWMIILVVGLWMLPCSGMTANRHIVQEYRLGALSTVTEPVAVEFNKNTMTRIQIKQLVDKSMLVLALQPDNGIFIEQFTEANKYVAVKTKARASNKEDLVVIGIEAALLDNRYTIKEIKIIGADELGNLRVYAVKDFNAVDVLKVPMQVNTKGELVFSQVGGTDMTIAWTGTNFVCNK